jgi:glucan phosphoethanolaminetransferase (alkaline phosphatase superfamily)
MYQEKLGGKFWLWLAGVLVVGAIALFLVLVFLTRSYYAWGAFGTFVVFIGILLVFAWVHDRREQHKYDDLEEA